jgi:branched-chain amino acid aminotransferase
MTQLTNSRLAWFNGKFMPENQVLIPFRDRSWRFGDGVRSFNGAKVVEGAPGAITKRLTDAYVAEVGCDFVKQYMDRLS